MKETKIAQLQESLLFHAAGHKKYSQRNDTKGVVIVIYKNLFAEAG